VEAAVLREVILHLLNHSPRDLGFDQTRWTLASLRVVLAGWLRVRSEAGLSRVLQRLEIGYRRGWEHLTSPDPLLNLKLAYLDAILTRARLYPDRVVVLWLDELTFYRLPSPAPAWSDGRAPRGPKAHLTPGSNTQARLGAVLNHFSGQVLYLLRSVCGVRQLIQLYHLIRAAYPDALEIYVIQDCWPVHFLPEVCQVACQLGITLVPLPTYSSWRNPIEKLWRWLKQSVLHLHPWAADWPRTKSEVCRFLDRFQQPSPPLLRYVGLSY
jgi:hypothetical protein